jgi:hypothetical protein
MPRKLRQIKTELVAFLEGGQLLGRKCIEVNLVRFDLKTADQR